MPFANSIKLGMCSHNFMTVVTAFTINATVQRPSIQCSSGSSYSSTELPFCLDQVQIIQKQIDQLIGHWTKHKQGMAVIKSQHSHKLFCMHFAHITKLEPSFKKAYIHHCNMIFMVGVTLLLESGGARVVVFTLVTSDYHCIAFTDSVCKPCEAMFSCLLLSKILGMMIFNGHFRVNDSC